MKCSVLKFMAACNNPRSLRCLAIGLAIALATSMAVGRAVLAGEAVLRDSEERLSSLNTTLEQKVDERTRELRELNEDLDQRVPTKNPRAGLFAKEDSVPFWSSN